MKFILLQIGVLLVQVGVTTFAIVKHMPVFIPVVGAAGAIFIAVLLAKMIVGEIRFRRQVKELMGRLQ